MRVMVSDMNEPMLVTLDQVVEPAKFICESVQAHPEASMAASNASGASWCARFRPATTAMSGAGRSPSEPSARSPATTNAGFIRPHVAPRAAHRRVGHLTNTDPSDCRTSGARSQAQQPRAASANAVVDLYLPRWMTCVSGLACSTPRQPR